MSASATHTRTARERDPDALRGVRRRPPRPKAVRDLQEVGLEDRLQHQPRRLLNDPVTDRRDPQRPAATIRLGDRHAPNRRGTIRALPKRTLKLAEHPLDAVRLDLGQRQPIDAGRAPVPAAPASTPPAGRHSCRSGHTARENDAPGTAWHMPIACVGVLARPRQWPPTPFRWTGRRASARRGRWVATPRPCPNAYLRRTRDQSRGPSLPARCSARRSSLLRPPRTPAALRSLSPSAYTSGLC